MKCRYSGKVEWSVKDTLFYISSNLIVLKEKNGYDGLAHVAVNWYENIFLRKVLTILKKLDSRLI